MRWAAGALGALVLLGAAFAGGVLVDQSYPEQVPVLGAHLQKRGSLDRAGLDQALRVVEAHYYDPGLDSSKLSRGSVRGLVQALGDPYTQYLDPTQFRAQEDFYAGRHNGVIGITVSYAGDRPVVASVLPGSPAQRAGLKDGDVILAIAGTDTAGLTADRASALIRGPIGRPVLLRLSRDSSQLDVSVQRADFKSPTVQSLRLEGDVLYVRVYEFGDDTLRDFNSQLRAGLPGARGVILDLRDNGGGLVAAAQGIISDFVGQGEAFEQRGRDGQVHRTQVSGGPAAPDVQLLVLVNAASASSSEITAGSLQTHGRARLVGTRTFGKGSIQVDYRLADGGDLHLTVEHWFLPGGRSVDQKVGLTPDVAVDLAGPRLMFDVAEPSRGHAGDTQLNRALELLAGR